MEMQTFVYLVVAIATVIGFITMLLVNTIKTLPNAIGAVLSALGGISFTGGLMAMPTIKQIPYIFMFLGLVMILIGCLKASGNYTTK